MMGRGTGRFRCWVLLALICGSFARGQGPAEPAEIERTLDKLRYSWTDAELLVDDLLLKGKVHRPAGVSTAAAVADVERLFYLFSHGYSGYGFFDDGTNWARAKENILAELDTRTSWSLSELTGLFRKHLGFIRDCHLMIDNQKFAVHRDFWYDTAVAVERESDQFRIHMDGDWREILSINGGPPADFIFPSLNRDGQRVFRLGMLSGEDPGGLQLELDAGNGARTITVPLTRSEFTHYSFKRFDRDEIGGIPVLRVRSFSDHFWQQLEAFVASAETLKDTPVVIVDVRGNHGGNERWPIRWIYGMTGMRAEWQFIFSELRSVTAVTGRANGMRHWLRITPDSQFLAEEVKRFDALLDDYRNGDQVAHWTEPRYPESTRIPNRTTIVVITNGLVGSAGEGFVMRVSRLENVVVVGENTRGALTFGNVSLHRLPNSGLSVWMPVNFGLFPDLKFREESGLEPDFWVPAADAVNAAVAAIRNGTIETAMPLTPEMRRKRFIPEDIHHIRRKLMVICGFLLLGLFWVVAAWRRKGRMMVPGSIWISIGVIWMILGHANGKVLMLELGAGLVAMGAVFLVSALIRRLKSRNPVMGP